MAQNLPNLVFNSFNDYRVNLVLSMIFMNVYTKREAEAPQLLGKLFEILMAVFIYVLVRSAEILSLCLVFQLLSMH